MSYYINFIIAIFIVVIVALYIFFKFKKDIEPANQDEISFSIDVLAKNLNETFNTIVNTNVYELGLNEAATKKRENMKTEMSKALRNCSFGNRGEKEKVKDYMKYFLQKYYSINEKNINLSMPFNNEDLLSIQDKFDILFYLYKVIKLYKGYAFEKLIEENNISIEKIYEDGLYYEINNADIDKTYKKIKPRLNYVDMLSILTQRIYQNSRGLSAIDELRDQKCLDGVSGGVSGIISRDYDYMEEIIFEDDNRGSFRHDSVWVLWHGKAVHLSFLSFFSKKELQRVCKNIYRYDAPYYLSGIKGRVVAEDQRGNRISVARPPFTDEWKFFVRMFESVKYFTLEKLITDEGSEIIIETLKYIILGSFVVITGQMASGKTTLLKALIRHYDPTKSIRVEEDIFETGLNKIYPRRNIGSFRKTDYISIENGLVFIKKTDGDVVALGELSDQFDAAALMQIAEISEMSICTSHQATTPKLIEYFRNAGLATHMFSNEAVAEEQVANAIQWDIHTEKERGGHRYIDRVTEIIPTYEEYPDGMTLEDAVIKACKKISGYKPYICRDIIVFENGRYVIKNKISERSLSRIKKILYEKSDEALYEFNKFYEKYYEKIEESEVTA